MFFCLTLCPRALGTQKTTGALVTAVSAHQSLKPGFALAGVITGKMKCFARLAGKRVGLSVIGHILKATHPFLLFSFACLVVCGLDEAHLFAALQMGVVLMALVACIGGDRFVSAPMQCFQRGQKWNEGA